MLYTQLKLFLLAHLSRKELLQVDNAIHYSSLLLPSSSNLCTLGILSNINNENGLEHFSFFKHWLYSD